METTAAWEKCLALTPADEMLRKMPNHPNYANLALPKRGSDILTYLTLPVGGSPQRFMRFFGTRVPGGTQERPDRRSCFGVIKPVWCVPPSRVLSHVFRPRPSDVLLGADLLEVLVKALSLDWSKRISPGGVRESVWYKVSQVCVR